MSECPKDFYLEPLSGTCKPCDELCHQATVRGTVRLCRRFCPVVVNAPVTEAPIATDPVTTVFTPSYEQSTNSLSSDGSLEAQYAVIILATLIILISLVPLVVLLKREIINFLNRRNMETKRETSPGTRFNTNLQI
ncbi:uncharacterized protein LOC125377981 [Haliotis rufescens]|uniref:uncharacterized protein LOC125377981 n=1 Tax=Haliotis rufescens TaxID=6454 RepID=UPI00201F6B17|nr:uncharacterized protein LOC125377981 [Haliotis rufescens]